MGMLLLSTAVSAQTVDQSTAQSVNKSAGKTPPPDLAFLEYLGTLEGDGENWTDVVNMELPKDAKPAAKTSDAKATKGKSKPETAAKSADSEK
jgi:hypothetical protein